MTRSSLIVLGLCVAWVSGASNMVFKKVEVSMGNVGSDDDMRIKICDKSKCCTTKVLSHLLKSEWVAKKKETWDGRDLGNCSSILFDENLSSIEVALLKDGKKNGPEVNSMKLTGQIGSDKKKTKAFNCGQYKFTAKDTIKSNFCTRDSSSSGNRATPTTSRTTTRSSSSSRSTPNMAFKKVVVQMGAVGSDDDMRLRICDTSKCCTTKKLSHLLSSEWVAKKKETWDGGDLGNCSSILFDQNLSSVEVAILKNGVKSAPEITSMEITGQIGSDKKKTQVFKCGAYKFLKNDAQETNFCLKGSSSSANRAATTTAKPKPTTKRPSSSSSTPSMVFKKVVVQMGAVGSDDDMSLKICDPGKCCTTKKLSHLLSSEWVAKKKETWDGGDLGNCSSILFDQNLSSVEVAILKNGKKTAPEITSMELTGQIGSDKKKTQVFKCGSYKFTKNDAQKTSFCLNNKAPPKPTTRPKSPSSTPGTHQVNNVIVQVGNDGSNDEISLDICNEKSALSCCNTGALDKSLSDDWSKNDKETWEKKRLGACKTTSFDPCKGFDVAIKKKSGKDSLKVSSITLELQKPTENTPSAKFVCKDYTVGASDTIIKRTCSLDSTSSKLSCPKTPPSSKIPTPAPRPSSVTNKPPTSPPRSPAASSGPCLRSGKNCEESVVTITSFEVQTAADGTEDPITAGVCSDTNDVDVCCQTGDLKKAGTNGWARNKKETWPLITLGRCAGEKFPIQATTTTTNLNQASLELSLNKRGSNKVELNEFIINAEDAKGAKRQFKCGKFSVDKPKVTRTCYARYPKAATRTTKRPSRTTTRPPFRSGSG